MLYIGMNCTLSALLCSAVVAAGLGGQQLSGKDASGKAKSASSTKQAEPDPQKSAPPCPGDASAAKCEAARIILEHAGVRLAIQSVSRSEIDTERFKTQVQELKNQLTSTDDLGIDEITVKAAGLLVEITKDTRKPPSRSDAIVKDPKPEASQEPTSTGGMIPLFLSIFALVFSVVAMIVGPLMSRSLTHKAIAKALRSAGLQ